MKKIMMLILSVLMIFSLTACGGSEPQSSEGITQPDSAEAVSSDDDGKREQSK